MSFSALSQFLSQVGVLASLDRRTQQIQTTVNDIHRRFADMSDTVANEISNLQASVSGLTDQVQKSTAMIQGLNQQLSAAIAAAANAGATPQQLEQLNALNQQITQDTADLAAAASTQQQQQQAPATDQAAQTTSPPPPSPDATSTATTP